MLNSFLNDIIRTEVKLVIRNIFQNRQVSVCYFSDHSIYYIIILQFLPRFGRETGVSHG